MQQGHGISVVKEQWTISGYLIHVKVDLMKVITPEKTFQRPLFVVQIP